MVEKWHINENFLKLWAHNLLKILNERFRELVVPLIVLGLSGSPIVTALVLLSQQLGTVLFAIPIGTWIEKKNPIFVSSSCSMLYAVLIFSLAYIVSVDSVSPVLIACILFLIGLVGLIQQTAFQVMIPRVVGRNNLLSAHNLLEGADAFVILIGPSIGGFLLAYYGASFTLVVCGCLMAISTLFISVVRYKHSKSTATSETKHIKEKVFEFTERAKEGVQYLFANSSQKGSTIAAVCLSFATVFMILSIIFHSRTTLDLSEQYIGILLSFAGLGNVIGVLIMNRFKKVNWLFFLSTLLILSSVGVLCLLSSHFIVMCIGMMIFDGALSMGFVVQLSVQQGITPDSLLARVRSAMYVIAGIASICATLLAGVFTEWNSYVALIFGGLMLLLPALYILRYKDSSVKMDQIKPIYMDGRKG